MMRKILIAVVVLATGLVAVATVSATAGLLRVPTATREVTSCQVLYS
jgi:hypothetical protein